MPVALPIALVAALVLAAALPKAPDSPKAAELATGAVTYLASGWTCDGASAGSKAPAWPVPRLANGRFVWKPVQFERCYLGTFGCQEALAAGVLWSEKGGRALFEEAVGGKDPLREATQTHSAFQARFGWPLPERASHQPGDFNVYEVRKLQALFDQLYFKPTVRVGELDAQAVYDLFFKPFLTRFARDAAFIQQKIPKAKRATLAKQYQADAKNTADGGEFYGPDYLGQLAAKVLPEDAQHAEARSGRTLGIMMRRQLDGTWPTVVKMLQTVLQDYDPALAKELKGAL